MKIISLLQPWASLIGVKKIETRSWATKYRGPLGIHASKAFPKVNDDLCYDEPFNSALKGLYPPTLGAIITTCNLVDCIEMTPKFIKTVKSPERDFGIYAVGRFAWILEDIKRLDSPMLAKGQLGLWNFEFERGGGAEWLIQK